MPAFYWRWTCPSFKPHQNKKPHTAHHLPCSLAEGLLQQCGVIKSDELGRSVGTLSTVLIALPRGAADAVTIAFDLVISFLTVITHHASVSTMSDPFGSDDASSFTISQRITPSCAHFIYLIHRLSLESYCYREREELKLVLDDVVSRMGIWHG